MAPLTLSSTFSSSKRPLSTTSLPNTQAYVLSIASLPGHYAAAASVPSNVIYLYDKSDCKTLVRTLPGHVGGISYMRTVDVFAGGRGEVLLSCGRDGSVKAWDERSGAVATQMSGRVPLLSCDASSDGLMVAAGTVLQGEDAAILYWDPRNPIAPLRRHTETHSDDVTALHFSRSGSTEVLLSASTDGLVSISNPNESDEDEAGVHVRNWGCSVSKAGWIRGSSSDGPRVWASSDMETLSIWTEELDLLQNLDRDQMAHPGPGQPWVTDYIVDCHTSRNGAFYLLSGSNEGDISLISPPESLRSESRWSLERLFSTGHTEIVRCALWDETAGILLTGGEDSTINVWTCPAIGTGGGNSNGSMDVDMSPSRKRLEGAMDVDGSKRVRTF